MYETYKLEFPEHNYIGKSVTDNVKARKYFGSGIALNKAIKKYGREAFGIHIIEEGLEERDAFDLERKLIEENAGYYNIAAGGLGFTSEEGKRYNKASGNKGRKHTTEARANMSKSQKGCKKPAIATANAKRRGELHASYGKPRPDVAERNRNRKYAKKV